MPDIARPDGTTIHYEVAGDGPALLLLAPDAVNSQIDSWERTPFDPRESLADRFRVISMDQRYAGRSSGPNAPFSYGAAAADQLAVLDAAGAERALVLGWSIGAAYALRLARDAPDRVAGAVLVEPLGRAPAASTFPEAPRHVLYAPFEETLRLARAEGLQAVVEAARRDPRFDDNPAAGPFGQRLHDDAEYVAETLDKGRERYSIRVVRFRDGMVPDDTPYLSVPEGWLPECGVPLLVLPGTDARHPPALARQIASAAKRARCLDVPVASREGLGAIRAFLLEA